jgi:hypothetical protein
MVKEIKLLSLRALEDLFARKPGWHLPVSSGGSGRGQPADVTGLHRRFVGG